MNHIVDYLKNRIGLDVIMINNDLPTGQLPFHLKKGNEMVPIKINGKIIVLIKPRHPEYPTPDQIKNQMEQIQKILQMPPVYVFDKVDTYTRKRMVQNNTAFIVENKQMYVPFMLIDLEEKKTSKEIKNQLSPAAQCIIIYHLLVQPLNNHNLKTIAEMLTYSPMTITRAVKELEEFGICESGRAKEKRVWFNLSGRELWENARSKMKTPIQKKIWVEEVPQSKHLIYSGISALSRYTNLSEDPKQTYAVNTDIYKQMKRDNMLIGENKRYGQIELEIWKYDPEILKTGEKVDPISLYLSMMNNEDERVEQALEQMMNELW